MSGAVKVVAMKHDPEGKKRLITLTQEKYKTSTFLALTAQLTTYYVTHRSVCNRRAQQYKTQTKIFIIV